jgi:predicted TIM-barrel fold metal-dependent hydrolase
MSTSGTTAVLEEELIVDTDVHLSVPVDDLAAYADEPHANYLQAPSVQLKSSGWDPTMGGKIEDRSVVGVDDIERVLRGDLHVDHPILNAFVNLARLSRSEVAVGLQRACNDYLLDRFLDDTGYHGVATVAPQKPDRAAEELDRIGDEDGIVGVFLPTTGPLPPLGDPEYDVLYQAVSDNDLVPVYHGATNSGFDVGFPTYNREFEKFITAHINAHLWSQTMTLTSLLVHGVPEKFPDLEFVVLEAGIGWVPYMMFRLNKEAAMRQSEVPLLEKRPEEYVRERFYFASQPLGEPMNPGHMQSIIDMVGVDSLLFATDYPHWDFDHPSELDQHLRSNFSGSERRKVLHENAADVFDIPLDR